MNNETKNQELVTIIEKKIRALRDLNLDLCGDLLSEDYDYNRGYCIGMIDANAKAIFSLTLIKKMLEV